MFGACSENDSVPEESTAAAEETVRAIDPTAQDSLINIVEPTSQDPSVELHFSTIEEYIDYSLGETDEDVYTTDVMTYTIYADQNMLVYDYTYIKQYDNVDEIKEKLEESFDPDNEIAQYLLSQLRKYVEVENPKIRYIFRNHNGAVITEYTYE